MERLKFILICIGFFWVEAPAIAQNLVACKLTDEDRKNEVHSAYKYDASDHFTIIRLCLYRDGNFHYSLKTFNQNVFSEGIWTQKDDTLILINKIQKGHLPVKLAYSNDSTELINGFKVAIVENLKGEEMPDGLVAINVDSNICLPSYGGMCRMEYTSIDSIRIFFENGLSSEWLRIDNRSCKRIIPVVQSNFLISSYMVFNSRRYLIQKSVLVPVD